MPKKPSLEEQRLMIIKKIEEDHGLVVDYDHWTGGELTIHVNTRSGIFLGSLRLYPAHEDAALPETPYFWYNEKSDITHDLWKAVKPPY